MKMKLFAMSWICAVLAAGAATVVNKTEERVHEKESPAHSETEHEEHAHSKGGHEEHAHGKEGHVHSETEHEEHAQDESEHVHGRVTFTVPDSALKILSLSYAVSERRDIRNVRRLPAMAEPDPRGRTEATVPVAGVLIFLKREFESVTKGEEIFRLTSLEWVGMESDSVRAAQAADAAAEEAELLKERADRLAAAGTRAAALEVEARVKARAATLLRKEAEGLARKTRMIRTLLRVNEDGTLSYLSPINGVLSRQFKENGAWAAVGDRVAEIVDPRAVRFRAATPANEVALFPPGAVAAIENSRGVKGVICGKDRGLPLRIGLTDPVTRLKSVVVYPEHLDDWMKEGACAMIAVSSPDPVSEDTVAVPDGAIVEDGVEHVAFVRHADGTFIKTPVEILARDNGWTRVHGLAAGVRVVTDGAYELKAAAPGAGTVKKAGHFHADGKFHTGED